MKTYWFVPFLALSVSCGGGGGGAAGPAFSADTTLPPQAVMEGLFEEELPDLHFTMSDEDWRSIRDDSRGNEPRRARIQGRQAALDPVGMRPTGFSSRYPGNPRPSLFLQFDAFIPGARFSGLQEVRLDSMQDDSSLMRERISYAVFGKRVAGPRVSPARLLGNGAYRGLYQVEEEINLGTLRERLGRQPGELYYVDGAQVDLCLWQGEDPTNYVPFPWTPRSPGNPQRVVDFLDVLNHRAGSVADVCDMSSLVGYFAAAAAVLSGIKKEEADELKRQISERIKTLVSALSEAERVDKEPLRVCSDRAKMDGGLR